jgi:hypothetical protein
MIETYDMFGGLIACANLLIGLGMLMMTCSVYREHKKKKDK